MAARPDYITPVFLPGGETGCLLIHGFTSSPLDVRPLTRYLHSLGFTAGELLLPGHGTSAQDMAAYGWAEWLQAVKTEQAKISARCPKTWLIGFSMGGILAALAAAESKAAGLVVIAAPIWPQSRRARFATLLKPLGVYAKLGKPSQQRYPSWRYDKVAVKNVADLFSLIKKAKRALPGVTVPTLVIQGLADRTVRPRSSHYIYKRLGAARKEIHYLPGGHMLLVGECWRVGQFIQQTGGDADASR